MRERGGKLVSWICKRAGGRPTLQYSTVRTKQKAGLLLSKDRLLAAVEKYRVICCKGCL